MGAVHWQKAFELVEQGNINASVVWTVKMNESIIQIPQSLRSYQTAKHGRIFSFADSQKIESWKIFCTSYLTYDGA